MHRSLPLAFGVLALAATGCDDKPAAPATTAAPTTTAAPAPTTTATATASAKPTASAVAAGAPADFGPFHAVAEGSAMTIYPMGDGAVVDTGAFYAVLGAGEELEQDPTLWRASVDKGGGAVTVTAAARYQRFFGAWPEQPWAMLDGTMMKKVGEVWIAQSPLRDGETLMDLTILEGKRALAAVKMTEPDIRFALAASSPGMIPAPGKPTPDQGDCKVRMDPGAPLKLGGVASGHMYAIGKECKTGKAIAERWEPKKARGEAAVIDGVEGEAVAVLGVSDSEAYGFFGGGGIATWDGKAWKGEKSTFGVPKSVFASADGTAFALADDGLYRHPKGGAWAKVEMGKAKATSAWAKDEKTIWVVADGKTLLRSGPATKPAMKLPSAADTQSLVEREKRWPATAACKKVYVWLGGLGPAGKVPTSWAPLTESVKGNAELTAKEIQYVVEELGGSLYAGAKLPTVALGEKLMRAFATKNDKAKVMMFCHEPMLVKGALKVE